MPRKPAKAKASEPGLNFASLVEAVRQVHERSAAAAARAVNVSLTLRNWLIGCYLVEYQQHGADRAQYGERLMDRLAAELCRQGVPASDRQRLYAYVAFYRVYPQIGEVIPDHWNTQILSARVGKPSKMVRSPTGQSAGTGPGKKIVRSPAGITPILGRMLVERLSYTHLEILAGLKYRLELPSKEDLRRFLEATEESVPDTIEHFYAVIGPFRSTLLML